MPEQATATHNHSLRVLLIEDSAVLRGMLLEYLVALPFVETVDWADSENMAVRLAANGHYHVVIVDLQLRQGNGINVLREMQKARLSGIRIVCTNHAQVPLYRRQCTEAGADYFFDKSLELDQVFRVIEDYAASSP